MITPPVILKGSWAAATKAIKGPFRTTDCGVPCDGHYGHQSNFPIPMGHPERILGGNNQVSQRSFQDDKEKYSVTSPTFFSIVKGKECNNIANMKEYHVYIITNPGRTVLYTGMTGNLSLRLLHHRAASGSPVSFAGKYHCKHLVYLEVFSSPLQAIEREKQIKLMGREAKLDLIKVLNPKLDFLDREVLK